MFSSFGQLYQVPKPVLSLQNDSIYFISTGGVDGFIYPLSLQKEEKAKGKAITMLLFQASNNLAEQNKITKDAAWDLLIGKTGVSINPLSYLDQSSGEKYLELSDEQVEVKQQIVGNVCRNRTAFHIVVSQAIKAKSKQLFIKRPWFLDRKAIEVGMIFKFPRFKVAVTDPFDPESDSIGITAIAGSLEPGEIGFLLRDTSVEYLMGDSTWTDTDTQRLTLENADGSKSQVDQIYDFFLQESGRLKTEETEGNLALQSEKSDSSNGTKPSLSTGIGFTGESSLADAEMNGSTPKTLDVALVG